jgi:chaperonin cofactor prefoldin
MDPGTIIAIVTFVGAGLLFIPNKMMQANDRIAAEKKAIDERFIQMINSLSAVREELIHRMEASDKRMEASERAMIVLQGVVESHQSAISHRVDLQEQKIGLTLDTILNQMKTVTQRLDEIQSKLMGRHE